MSSDILTNERKIILDLCGGTGAWSKPYSDAGYDVRLITLPDHDVLTYTPLDNVYGILAAPPCTEFSFAKSNSKYPRDIRKGMEIVAACYKIIWEVQYKLPTPLAKRTNLKFWALENPFGLLRRLLGYPVLTFHPYDYGDRSQKKTCLWGYFNIPKKDPIVLTKDEKIKFSVNSAPLHNLPDDYRLPDKTEKRTAQRAITPPGFAKAFFNANR